MNNEIQFNTFPKNRYEALTMLYLKNQDLTGVSPEKLYDMYSNVLKAIQTQASKPIKGKH